jgi:hypothetical protein
VCGSACEHHLGTELQTFSTSVDESLFGEILAPHHGRPKAFGTRRRNPAGGAGLRGFACDC